MLRWPDKDPDDAATYALDWSAAIPAGDALTACAWSATPAGLTVNGNLAAPVAKATISGGDAGQTYLVRARATLQSGQQLDQTVMLKVRNQ